MKKKQLMEYLSRYRTIVLKIFIIFIGLSVLSSCIIGLISLVKSPISPNYSRILYPIIVGLYLSVIPFFLVLYKAFILLLLIEKNNIFTQVSINVLQFMKYCTYMISMVYVIIMPFLYLLAEKDDAPGLIMIGVIPIFSSITIGISFTIFQGILIDAIKLKLNKEYTE
jgi:hypothetical protein